MASPLANIMESGFSAVDFVIFGLFLALSVGIGAYHAWKSRKVRQQSTSDDAATAEFLMGGRKMPIIPVSLSLLTTFLSGITMLGTPAEIYQRGMLFWVYYMMAPVVFLVSAVFFLPIFYKLRPTSIYVYFEQRFNSKLIRQLAAALFLANTVFYMSVVLYAPSVALSGVTGVDTWPFILVVGLCCTLYTTIGGLKAVVWTDTLQAVFMYAGVAALIIKSTADAGGISNVFKIASDLDRFAALTRIDPDPAQHNSLWISIFGAFGLWMSLYGLNQMALQRYCSLPSYRDAKIVVAITIPCFILLGTMACYIGLVMLAYFVTHGGDPLQKGELEDQDQLVIRFANDVLGVNGVPGLPGLFLACLFSSTLSTISSGMNSMAAVAWEDFIKGHIGEKVSDDTAALINKFMVLGFGVIAVCLAFLAGPMGGIMKASITTMGALSGPLIGLFFFGVFVPNASRRGALIALLSVSLLNFWMAVGNFATKPYAGYSIPTNFTNYTVPDHDPHYGNQDVFYMYRISGYLYPIIGIVLVLIVGTISSHFLPDPIEFEVEHRNILTFRGRNDPVSPKYSDALPVVTKL